MALLRTWVPLFEETNFKLRLRKFLIYPTPKHRSKVQPKSLVTDMGHDAAV
jgi:hypothetical protein